MAMRPFALTYPQLMNQALAQGLDEESLRRMRTAYELAEWEFDGFYRGQGMSFLCHLVRTASIVLAERQPIHVVMAALLHALYRKEEFYGARNGQVTWRKRNRVQGVVGKDVEALIWEYRHFPWSTEEAMHRHLEHLETYGERMRQILVVRLANQLEDYLDLGMIYRGASPSRMEREFSYWEESLLLARRLGLVQLAEEMDEAYKAHRTTPSLPGNVLRHKGGVYKLPDHHWLYEGWVGELRNRLRKWLKPTQEKRQTFSEDGNGNSCV